MSTSSRPAIETKHLELIQAVVTRLAGNSFTAKGWSITLIAAIVALSSRTSQPGFVIVGLLPALCFWGLDAYYLRQERLFRKLYDAVRMDLLAAADPPRIERYSMDVTPVMAEVESWWATLIAGVVIMVHGPILAAVISVAAFALLTASGS